MVIYFCSVLGNITSSEEGLPKENLDSYLVRGYNRNDRVGKSYIEQRYEDVLHGTKEEVKILLINQETLLAQK